MVTGLAAARVLAWKRFERSRRKPGGFFHLFSVCFLTSTTKSSRFTPESSRLTRNNSEGMGSGRAAMERAGVAAGGHTPETANSDQSKAEIVVH